MDLKPSNNELFELIVNRHWLIIRFLNYYPKPKLVSFWAQCVVRISKYVVEKKTFHIIIIR